jgi:uroporphyrinogen decarboxylase
VLPRERVFAAVDRTGPDRPPLYVPRPTDGVLCEQGQGLLDLLQRYPQDFGDLSDLRVPPLPPHAFDDEYRETRVDVWGVTWEFRIFGHHGHPVVRPLDDLRALDSYQPPSPPPMDGPGFEAQCRAAAAREERFYFVDGWVTIFEVLHAVRRFEDVLMDLASDEPHLHRIGDMIADYDEAWVRQMLAYGVDGVMFADDWGTASGPMISRELWRRFFRPRYERVMAPVKAAGKHVFFHSCGCTEWLWEELAELGIDVFWPQLTANDNARLAAWCHRHGVALLAHPDRAELMVREDPEAVRAEVRRLVATFGSPEGGLLTHGEVDRGFSFVNLEALYSEVFARGVGA